MRIKVLLIWKIRVMIYSTNSTGYLTTLCKTNKCSRYDIIILYAGNIYALLFTITFFIQQAYFSGVQQLSEQLGKQLWLLLGRSLNTVRKEPQVIVTAVRIIEREERADAYAIQRQKQSGFMSPDGPKKWKGDCNCSFAFRNSSFRCIQNIVIQYL